MLSLTALMTLLLAQELLPQGQADPSRAKPGVESTLQDPEDPALRAATKGLGFLEKEGIAWTKKNKCSSCHHVPMMLWAEREARQGGLRINEQARERAVAFALQAPYGGFLGPLTKEKLAQMPGPSLEIIYLALGLDTEGGAGEVARKNAELRTHLLDKQEPNGAWLFERKEKGKLLPPIQDADDVVTMLSLLALSRGTPSPLEPETARRSQERALAWLQESTFEQSLFSTALGVVISRNFAMADRMNRLKTSLLSEQREDGGWTQVAGRPSDALATGQALYALADAGIDTKHQATQRGRAFLERTQRDNGSWRVSSRIPENEGKDAIPSYFGSAWAVLGLVHHRAKE